MEKKLNITYVNDPNRDMDIVAEITYIEKKGKILVKEKTKWLCVIYKKNNKFNIEFFDEHKDIDLDEFIKTLEEAKRILGEY